MRHRSITILFLLTFFFSVNVKAVKFGNINEKMGQLSLTTNWKVNASAGRAASLSVLWIRRMLEERYKFDLLVAMMDCSSISSDPSNF